MLSRLQKVGDAQEHRIKKRKKGKYQVKAGKIYTQN